MEGNGLIRRLKFELAPVWGVKQKVADFHRRRGKFCFLNQLCPASAGGEENGVECMIAKSTTILLRQPLGLCRIAVMLGECPTALLLFGDDHLITQSGQKLNGIMVSLLIKGLGDAA